MRACSPVSYTHLDVYKRQEKYVLTRQESSVVVDVEVEADKLKKMPEEAVQTLRLNIAPVSIPSVLAEQNDVSGLSAQ